MHQFDPDDYGPEVGSFLRRARGAADLARISSAAQLFGNDAPLAREALAGLWLHLDEFDRAHALAQDLGSREGSFWHGILHRREPDPANAAYWFRRVGRHAVFPALAEAAAGLGYPAPGAAAEWDPFAWIDYWEASRRRPAGSREHSMALAVQRVEWEILFDYCARFRKPS